MSNDTNKNRRTKKKMNICILCQQHCYGKNYCTLCYTKKAQIGRIPWNKNKKTGIVPKTAFKRGIRFNPEGEFKKNEGKHFKGTIREYKAIHAWMYYHLGTAKQCVFCGSNDNVEWANKSRQYYRDLSDWVELCKKCHFAYDRQTQTTNP
jgi:hypothetical protein